ESKIIFVFDVSGSMFSIDDLPEPGQDPKTLPTRQDKILNWLASKTDDKGHDRVAFIDRVLEKSPLTLYRFGPTLDETDVLNFLPKDKEVAHAQLAKWLKPSRDDIPKPNREAFKDDDDFKKAMDLYNRK